MHGKYLNLLNPDNSYLKFNLHFYILLVGSIKNLSEVQVRKSIVKAVGQTHTANVLKWQKERRTGKMVITHQNLIAICNYLNSQIPYLNLNSDDMLVSNNDKAKQAYRAAENINPKRLGLER